MKRQERGGGRFDEMVKGMEETNRREKKGASGIAVSTMVCCDMMRAYILTQAISDVHVSITFS